MIMLGETVAALLRTIDEIEREMRGLEGRLTGVREQLHKALGGDRGPYELNGQRKAPKPLAAKVPENHYAD